MSDGKRKLEMRISLNALQHLGMNLYSNVPAVLSEIVANAWDADASRVRIALDKAEGVITIDDDGNGMTRDEVVDRFLTVGFRRRDVLGDETAKGRRPMGRKGIGKLSAFSIARIVEVHTEKEGERTAFRMDREEIQRRIEANSKELYEPTELDDWPSDHLGGTRIVLSGLATKMTKMTDAGLRRRVARRFSIIGPKNDFVVTVNGREIGPADRGYHAALEYMWVYGDQTETVGLAKNLKRKAEDRTEAVTEALADSGLGLRGWIGTVERPAQLRDEEGDNLNRIAVFMRGKLAQEDMLDDFAQKEIYADYVIGELHCDELDLDAEADIATSSRQSLKQDDPRYQRLRSAVLAELRHIAGQWTDLRNEDGTKFARSVPAVASWLDDLTGDTRKKAQRWVGRLNEIRSDKDTDRKELLKASILAFESYRHREQLDRLGEMTAESVAAILPIFRDVDGLEQSYYGQIVNLRLGVVRKLQQLTAQDVREKVIQEHVYEHLWLVDPSWERVKGTEHMETRITGFLKGAADKLSEDERKGRIDVVYRTASGAHVIIELKRSSVSTPVDRLASQVRKYRDGVRKLVATSDYPSWPIQIVCLVGKPPPEWHEPDGESEVRKTLEAVDARIVFYDQLIDNAQKAYADYLEAHKKTDRLWEVFRSIDDFVPPDPPRS